MKKEIEEINKILKESGLQPIEEIDSLEAYFSIKALQRFPGAKVKPKDYIPGLLVKKVFPDYISEMKKSLEEMNIKKLSTLIEGMEKCLEIYKKVLPEKYEESLKVIKKTLKL